MLKQIAFIFFIFLFSCKNKNALPSGILNPAKMQIVLWDVLRTDAFTFNFVKKDSTLLAETESVKLQQQIFTVHKISRDEFYNSYRYYQTHPQLMQPLLESMINKITRDKFYRVKEKEKPLNDTLKAI
jgi:hypothetical protein